MQLHLHRFEARVRLIPRPVEPQRANFAGVLLLLLLSCFGSSHALSLPPLSLSLLLPALFAATVAPREMQRERECSGCALSSGALRAHNYCITSISLELPMCMCVCMRVCLRVCECVWQPHPAVSC